MTGVRVGISLLVVLAALAVELRLTTTSGAAPDLALAALLVFASAGGLPELAAGTALATLGLNWQPAMSPEMFWLIALPFVAALLSRILPFQRWAVNLALVGGGLALFPLLVAPEFLAREPGMFGWSVLIGTAFGAALFGVLEALANATEAARYPRT